MSVQGYLKIKTKIDNKDVDKGVAELEDKIKKLQTDNVRQSNKENDLRAEIRNFEELTQQADKYHQRLKEINEMPKKRAPQLQELIETERLYKEACSTIDKQANKINKVYSKLEQVKIKQEENNRKIEEYKQKIEQINLKKIQSSLNDVGKGLQSHIRSLGKMALAVFGVRTAYNAVRGAISTLSQYNPQIAADIEYIRYALASMLLPVVQKLISLAYTLLSYINAIASAWFGINLFASAKAFQSMKASAGSTAKSAKEIQRSLQGFDEMNVLQDNSSTGGSGGGISAPSMDLSEIQGEVPNWLQWILDNKDIVLATLAGIAAGVLAIKFGLGGIKALGIGIMIAGIISLIQSVIAYLKDGSWNNFGKIITSIGIAILGLALIIGSLPVAIAGAITMILGLIISNWEKIKAFFQGGIDWLTGKSDWVHEMFGDVIGNIYDSFVDGLQMVLNVFDNFFKMIKGIFDGLIMFIKGVFTGDWKQAWEGIKKIFSSIWDGIKGIVVSVWNYIKTLVVNIGQTVGNIISSAFKAVVNAVLRTIENILNAPIRAVNGLIGVINAIPGVNLGYLSTFNLPRLAKGGIISQPTTAIIGEAGKEAVMPLENNTEWIDMLADKLAGKIGSNGGAYIIQMDGRTIDRGIAKRRQELSFVTNGR